MKRKARVVLLFLLVTLLTTFMVGAIVAVGAPLDGVNPGEAGNRDVDLTGNMEEKTQALGGTFFRYLQIIGSIVAVVILAVYGIQWFLASPQQKAILKEKAWSYVIGAILIFGSSALIGLLADLVTKNVTHN